MGRGSARCSPRPWRVHVGSAGTALPESEGFTLNWLFRKKGNLLRRASKNTSYWCASSWGRVSETRSSRIGALVAGSAAERTAETRPRPRTAVGCEAHRARGRLRGQALRKRLVHLLLWS